MDLRKIWCILEPLGTDWDTILLSGPEVTIGRSSRCHLCISSPHISSTHAKLRYNEETGELTVTDMNSANGTLLNGEKIAKGEATPMVTGAC